MKRNIQRGRKKIERKIGSMEAMGETILMMAAGYHKKSCMKRVASPGSMHDTGCLGLVHWDDPEGWYGEGGRGEEGSGWGTHVYLWRADSF